ncbi:hypothetical protein Tco_0989461, partial [Tanacetum coccineum]
YAKLIQELLTNISKTCPRINNTDGKLVAVTPKNKDKRVRFTEHVTSSGNTITKTASTSNLVSNKPMLSSTGIKLPTSASGSQPSGNIKKDKIQQTPISIQKNKVQAHPRKVKSNLCVLDVINNVKARVKSNLLRKVQKKSLGNQQEVPLRIPSTLDNKTPKPVVTLVYLKTNGPVSKSKVFKSVSANKKEPSQSWGSIVSDVPSSSLAECRSSKLFYGIWSLLVAQAYDRKIALPAHQFCHKFLYYQEFGNESTGKDIGNMVIIRLGMLR